MKKILFVIGLFISFAASAQFPNKDSLQRYINRWIRNSPVEAFTNLRLNTALNGLLTEVRSIGVANSGILSMSIVTGDTLQIITTASDTFNVALPAGSMAATNLSVSRTATQVNVQSSTGTTGILPPASQFFAGVMVATDKAKLDSTASLALLRDSVSNRIYHIYRRGDSVFYVKSGAEVFAFLADASVGSGTVTNVASGYGLSGGPITGSGTLVVDSATLSSKYIRRADSLTAYTTRYRLDTANTNLRTLIYGKLSNITGLVSAGTGISLSGTGATGDPYVVSSAISGGTVTSVGSGYGLTGGPITGSGTLVVDSAALASKFLRRADTSLIFTDYRNAINTRVKYTDTSAMLAAYITSLNSKVKYSDTASMLANYLTAINNRVKYTDTSSMLTAYRNALNTKQGIISLTTIGGSGPATFDGTTLNIPSYTGGGTGGDNGMTGTGVRPLYQGSQNLRTLIASTGMVIDSTTNTNSLTFRVDTASILSPYQTAINARLKLSDTSAMLAAYINSLNSKVKYSDTSTMLTAYRTALNTKLGNVTNYVNAGTNVTRSGSGTLADPYIFSATGGSGSDNGVTGTGIRPLYQGTQNLRTLVAGAGMVIDTTTNANSITQRVDTATIFTSLTTAINARVTPAGTNTLTNKSIDGDNNVVTNIKQSAITKSKIFSVMDYGATGNGSTDDAAAFQACFDAAILAHGKVLIPSPAVYYRIVSTIDLQPNAASTGADNEIQVDVEGHGTPREMIKYEGASGTAAFNINGLRFSTWNNVDVLLPANTNMIGFDLDTRSTASSFSFNSFISCDVVLGNATGQRGWRVGHTSANGGDISDILWQNCLVYGVSKAVTGTVGWNIEGSNTLQNVFQNCFAALLDYGYSNVSGTGAAGTGNGGVYFFGFGTSQNNTDIRIGNNQSYVFSGGRFESGERVLMVENSNISPSIIFQGTEINDYTPSDGILFYMDMPGFLGLYGVNIQTGPTESAYGSNMIKLYGGGSGTGIGRLIVDGGSIEASDPFYDESGNDTDWEIYVRGVGQQNSTGVNVAMMTDIPVISGGSGTDNSVVGSGYRPLSLGSQNLRSLFNGTGILIDSTSNTNGLTWKVDTSVIATQSDLNDAVLAAGGGVTSVAGTSNRITSSGGTTPIIDISSSYVGQTSITTLGTVTTATYQATPIADAYISSASTWNAKQNAITTGTTAQYFRGDLSLATFPTTVSTFTNDAGYLTNITGKVSAGTNVTITGSGTTASPYVVNASGGGSTLVQQTLTDGSTTTWDITSGAAAAWTIAGNRTLSITNAGSNPFYGVVRITQGTGGNFIPTLPGHYEDVIWRLDEGEINELKFYFDGSTYHWESDFSMNTSTGSELEAPATFTVTPLSSTSNSIMWSAVTNATSYRLQRATSINFRNNLVTIYTGSGTSYTNTGLTADLQYFYRIQALASGYQSSAYAYVEPDLASTLGMKMSPLGGNIAIQGSNTWETSAGSGLGTVLEPSFVIEGDTLKMYYTGSRGDTEHSIGMAYRTSVTGGWTKYGSSALIAPSGRRANSSCVIKDPATGNYYCYALDGYGFTGDTRKVYLYKSTNKGYTWTDLGIIFDGIGSGLSDGSTKLGYGNTTIWPEAVGGVYYGIADIWSTSNIWEDVVVSATSLEGPWTIGTTKLTSLQLETSSMYGGGWLSRTQDGYWHLFYHYGVAGNLPTSLAYARSTNLTSWTLVERDFLTYHSADNTPPTEPASADSPYPVTDQIADPTYCFYKGKIFIAAEYGDNSYSTGTALFEIRDWKYAGTFGQLINIAL